VILDFAWRHVVRTGQIVPAKSKITALRGAELVVAGFGGTEVTAAATELGSGA
jgi:hypothetical protein